MIEKDLVNDIIKLTNKQQRELVNLMNQEKSIYYNKNKYFIREDIKDDQLLELWNSDKMNIHIFNADNYFDCLMHTGLNFYETGWLYDAVEYVQQS